MYKLNEIPDYEGLLKQALDKIPDTYDKREGSVIFNAIAPMCMEMSYLYLKLRTMTDLVFIDTSVGNYLDRLVLQNGIQRLDATYAEKYGTFNLPKLEGSFFLKDNVMFEVIEQLSNPSQDIYVYRLRCTQLGEIGNVQEGPLTSLNYIRNLIIAEISGTIKEGTDTETDDHLRQRYIDNVTDIAYGGNKADYRQKIEAMDGVGGCKVIPVWNGPGTVKCIITDADYTSPSEELVEQIQNAVDPDQNAEGTGLAPIGHIVTIEGAEERNVDIMVELQLDGPKPEDLENQIELAINKYLNDLNRSWESTDNLVVRISQLTNVLFDIDRVIDVVYVGIRTEDGSFVDRNLVLTDNQLARLGQISIVN